MANSGKYEALALAIASGCTVKDAAQAVQCSARAAYRLNASPKFRARVSAIRSEITAQAVGKLTHAATTAVDTLVELLGVEHEATMRLNAAKAILANVGPMSELGELRARVDALERAGRSVNCRNS